MKNNYNFETDTITYKDHIIENFFKDFPQQDYIKNSVRDNLICLYVGGSHAYGLDTETSDVDIRGIFKDSIDMILGYQKVEQLENSTNDQVIYSLSKCLPLIAEGNPNVMECLWVDEEEILFATEDYWYLRSRRDELLSKIVKHKYSGYAMSQLKRIRGHSKWLTKEQEGKFDKKPNIKDYIIHIHNVDGYISKWGSGGIDFSENRLFFTKVRDDIYNVWYDNYSNTYPLIENGNSFIPIQECAPDIYKSVSNEERYSYYGNIWFNKSQFQTDLDEYNNWKRWKENRNEARHLLEEEFGFDTKHGMHCIRLLRMGEEILKGEGVKVKRPDRDYLLAIRQGKVSYEDLLEEAELLDKELLDKAYRFSKLQNSVDKKIVVDIIKEILKLK
jgi:predicted nucleotidyltransferase